MVTSHFNFRWLKRFISHSLSGRVALILILPLVVVQLVVSTVFIQRHLEDVTTQMTLTVVRELQMIANQVAMAPDRQTMLAQMGAPLETLKMAVRFIEPDEVPMKDDIRWHDFSARIVISTLREALPQTRAGVFPDNYRVIFYFHSHLGPLEIGLDRGRVSAAAPRQLIVTMVFFGALISLIAFLYWRNSSVSTLT